MPTREPPKPAPGITAPAPPLPAWSPPSTGAGAVLAGGPAAVLALQRTCGNRAVGELLQRAAAARRPQVAPAPPPAGGGVVQRVKEVELPMEQYGMGFSADALDLRIRDRIAPERNIATFHFIERPRRGDRERRHAHGITVPSTGQGTYRVVGSGKYEVRTNESHSEHQVISALAPLTEGRFPAEWVVDWVYTERPACPDICAAAGGRLAKGCNTEIRDIEGEQKLWKWDHQRGDEGGALDDFEITVFYTFSSADEIGEAQIFQPARLRALRTLASELQSLGEEDAVRRASRCLGMRDDYYDHPTLREYTDIMNNTVDEVVRMARLRRAAADFRGLLGGVPDWMDYRDHPHRYERDVQALTGYGG